MTERWAKVPECVLVHPDLSDGAVRLYGVLARYGVEAIPKRATLAEQLRCSVDTIDRRAAELVAAKLLEIEHRYDDDGRQRSSTWRLLVKEPQQRGTRGREDAAHGGRTSAAPRKRPPRNERVTANAVTPADAGDAGAQARAIVSEAWNARIAAGKPRPSTRGNAFMALAKIVERLLADGHDGAVVQRAIEVNDGGWTLDALQHVMGTLRRGRATTRDERSRESAARMSRVLAKDRPPTDPLAALGAGS